jgi:hypothetical protein
MDEALNRPALSSAVQLPGRTANSPSIAISLEIPGIHNRRGRLSGHQNYIPEATQLHASPVITVEISTRIHPGLLAEAFARSLQMGETLWHRIVDDEACIDTTGVCLHPHAEETFCWMPPPGRHRSMQPLLERLCLFPGEGNLH